MKRWFFRSTSVRLRMTIWFAATLALILTLYSAAIFSWLRKVRLAELDFHLHQDFEAAEESLRAHTDGSFTWHSPASPDEMIPWDQPWWAEVWSQEGKLLFSTKPEKMSFPSIGASDCATPHFSWQTMRSEPGNFRAFCGLHGFAGRPAVLRVFRPETALQHELAQLLLMMGIILPLGIGISGIGGYFLAKRSLRPVEQMTTRARIISADRLEERLPVLNPDDELGRLSSTFNDTFSRLEKSFEQMRRFTADASHELRTPLTALRSMGEVSLRGQHDAIAYREVIASMLEEVDQMRQLVESLLTLSRADSNELPVKKRSQDLTLLVREVTSQLEVLAEEKGQPLTVEAEAPVYAAVDGTILRQAVMNFLDNAIKYSPPRQPIRVKVARREGMARIEVRDRGPGISTVHRARIFDRFYRIDRSRTRSVAGFGGGFGLGLSIARWAVEVNGGKVELESQEGGGSTFSIVLPEELPHRGQLA